MQRGGYGFTITNGRIKPTVADHHWLQPNLYFWSLLKRGGLPPLDRATVAGINPRKIEKINISITTFRTFYRQLRCYKETHYMEVLPILFLSLLL